MPFHFIYEDFLEFLEKVDGEGEKWRLYNEIYLQPNREFLLGYWKNFEHFNLDVIKERVKRIKKGDYSNFLSLLNAINLKELTLTSFKRCTDLIPPKKEVHLFFFVGFFSSDAFCMELNGKPVLGFGLERYKDFGSIPIMVAHEYCHFLQKVKGLKLNRFLKEGLCCAFSQRAFPQKPLYEHLFIDRKTFNWLEERKEKIIKNNGDIQLPERSHYYIGYSILKEDPIKFLK